MIWYDQVRSPPDPSNQPPASQAASVGVNAATGSESREVGAGEFPDADLSYLAQSFLIRPGLAWHGRWPCPPARSAQVPVRVMTVRVTMTVRFMIEFTIVSGGFRVSPCS